jgi:clan AA aspartic protease (TIGR02281 family)
MPVDIVSVYPAHGEEDSLAEAFERALTQPDLLSQNMMALHVPPSKATRAPGQTPAQAAAGRVVDAERLVQVAGPLDWKTQKDNQFALVQMHDRAWNIQRENIFNGFTSYVNRKFPSRARDLNVHKRDIARVSSLKLENQDERGEFVDKIKGLRTYYLTAPLYEPMRDHIDIEWLYEPLLNPRTSEDQAAVAEIKDAHDLLHAHWRQIKNDWPRLREMDPWEQPVLQLSVANITPEHASDLAFAADRLLDISGKLIQPQPEHATMDNAISLMRLHQTARDLHHQQIVKELQAAVSHHHNSGHIWEDQHIMINSLAAELESKKNNELDFFSVVAQHQSHYLENSKVEEKIINDFHESLENKHSQGMRHSIFTSRHNILGHEEDIARHESALTYMREHMGGVHEVPVELTDDGLSRLYMTTVYINGYPLEMAADTGATYVILTKNLAEEFGFLSNTFPGINIPVSMGNTTTLNKLFILPYLRVGDIVLKDVKAVVNLNEATTHHMLGLSALDRLSFYRSVPRQMPDGRIQRVLTLNQREDSLPDHETINNLHNRIQWHQTALNSYYQQMVSELQDAVIIQSNSSNIWDFEKSMVQILADELTKERNYSLNFSDIVDNNLDDYKNDSTLPKDELNSIIDFHNNIANPISGDIKEKLFTLREKFLESAAQIARDKRLMADMHEIPVELTPNGDSGAYRTDTFINGYRIQMKVDTAATHVTLSRVIGEKLRFLLEDFPADDYRTFSTGNGPMDHKMITLPHLQIGNIVLENVTATVALSGENDVNLLGLSALNRLSYVGNSAHRLPDGRFQRIMTLRK